jgi:hypothetical protein
VAADLLSEREAERLIVQLETLVRTLNRFSARRKGRR